MQEKRVDLGRLYHKSKSGFWVDAIIFPTKKAMQKWLRENHSDPSCEAICVGFRKLNVATNRKTKQLGTLCFYNDFLGAGVVAHECTHAALDWLRTKYPKFQIAPADGQLTPDDHPEEKLCDVVGNLSMQFWTKYYENEESL